MPRVLLVSYEFPPKGGPGVQRPAKLSKYLARAGWDVSVLTVADPPTALRDESLLKDIPGSVVIVRSWSAEITRVIRWFRRVRFGNRRATRPGGAVHAPSFSGASPIMIRAAKAFFVPDEKRFWLPSARRDGLRYLAGTTVDVILSTGPPHTAHLVALALSRQTGIPYVVDFRDPWLGNVNLVAPTSLHRRLHARGERRVVEQASAVVAVSDAIADQLQLRYPDARVVTIPNGYDAEDLPVRVRETRDRMRLVYTGTFSPPRTPELFLSGLASAEAIDPRIADVLEVELVGSGLEVEQVSAALGVRTPVRSHGYLPHEDTLGVLSRADAGLLVLSPGRESEVSLTGKLFEYLGMRLPVLAVTGDGPVARLAEKVSGIVVADPADPETVGRALIAMTGAWKSGALQEPTAEEVAAFDRREQAQRFSELLSDVAHGDPTDA